VSVRQIANIGGVWGLAESGEGVPIPPGDDSSDTQGFQLIEGKPSKRGGTDEVVKGSRASCRGGLSSGGERGDSRRVLFISRPSKALTTKVHERQLATSSPQLKTIRDGKTRGDCPRRGGSQCKEEKDTMKDARKVLGRQRNRAEKAEGEAEERWAKTRLRF